MKVEPEYLSGVIKEGLYLLVLDTESFTLHWTENTDKYMRLLRLNPQYELIGLI